MLSSYLIRDLHLPAPNDPYSPLRASSLLQAVVLNQAVMMALNHVDIFSRSTQGHDARGLRWIAVAQDGTHVR